MDTDSNVKEICVGVTKTTEPNALFVFSFSKEDSKGKE